MGAGFHGGFGATAGASRNGVVVADSTLVGRGEGETLKNAATMIKKGTWIYGCCYSWKF